MICRTIWSLMMKKIEIEDMSTEFEVRVLEKSDVDIVYDLSIKNSIYLSREDSHLFRWRVIANLSQWESNLRLR